MGIIVVTGATGAPGVTTTCLGLTLGWPRAVLLADCNPRPDQAVAAGYLRGIKPSSNGLMSLTQAHREHRDLSQELWSHATSMTDTNPPPRRFLSGFSNPQAVRLFEPVWPSLAQAFESLDQVGADVVADAGAISNNGINESLLECADLIMVVTRSSLRSLISLQNYLPILAGQVESLRRPKAMGLAVVGPHRPYSSSEITSQFGLEPWHEIAWRPSAAQVLSDGAPESRRFRRSGLMREYRSAARSLSHRLHHERELTRELTSQEMPNG